MAHSVRRCGESLFSYWLCSSAATSVPPFKEASQSRIRGLPSPVGSFSKSPWPAPASLPVTRPPRKTTLRILLVLFHRILWHHRSMSTKNAPATSSMQTWVSTRSSTPVFRFALIHSMHIGWTISQLNLSTFHDPDTCEAQPVAPGTCLMFPGHSTGSWTWVVSLWTVGGVTGSLVCARISDQVGRKKALMVNAILMVVGAVIQSSASNLAVYAVSRLITGMASGFGSVIPNSYINEISPPHMRNRLGSLYQISLCVFLILVGATFFFANTSSGWRYIGGFPVVRAGVFLLGAPSLMVESPAWLLEQGRRKEAEQVIARLFGSHNGELALSWLSPQEVWRRQPKKLRRPTKQRRLSP